MFRRLSTILTLSFVSACGSDAPDQPLQVDPGPFCVVGTLPFVVTDTDWRLEENESQSEILARIKHQPSDILSNGSEYAYTDVSGATPMSSGNYVARGIMARTKESQGLAALSIAGELTSLWGQDDGAWIERGKDVMRGEETTAPCEDESDLGKRSVDGASGT